MCSTPFGIIGIHTKQIDFGVREVLVLNAFRHHWNSHPYLTTSRTVPQSVLNAFRHHWNSHGAVACKPRRDRTCSTPFGIIGIHTGRHPDAPLLLSACSTPFGIIGIHTSSNESRTSKASGAQRLSASLEFTHPLDSGSNPPDIDRAQRPSASLEFTPHQSTFHAMLAVVLNAFRHHWNSHTPRGTHL